MISLNTVFSAPGPSSSRASGPPAGGKKPESQSTSVGDQVVLTGTPLATVPQPEVAPQGSSPGRLKETVWSSALQSLPPEGKAARLLDSKPAPLTQQQRDGCIADLETLHLAGDLKFFDTDSGEYSSCGVAQGLERMAQGEPLFYGGGGRQPQMTQIGSLEKLSALAQQAALGIVG